MPGPDGPVAAALRTVGVEPPTRRSGTGPSQASGHGPAGIAVPAVTRVIGVDPGRPDSASSTLPGGAAASAAKGGKSVKRSTGSAQAAAATLPAVARMIGGNLPATAATGSTVRIMGIDPGSQRTGVGIVDVDAAGRSAHVHHQTIGLLDNDSFSLRLKQIFDDLGELIERWQPAEIAIERVFAARNNAESVLKLGQARGAAICAVVHHGRAVHEYAAKEVKQAVVGRGAADKGQIQHMVAVLLGLTGKIQADAADALAIALTHAHTRSSLARTGLDRGSWRRRR